jgi:hypothetical protein
MNHQFVTVHSSERPASYSIRSCAFVFQIFVSEAALLAYSEYSSTVVERSRAVRSSVVIHSNNHSKQETANKTFVPKQVLI